MRHHSAAHGNVLLPAGSRVSPAVHVGGPELLARGRGVAAGRGLRRLARVPEVRVLEVERVGRARRRTVDADLDRHVVALARVCPEVDAPGEYLAYADEDGVF